MAAILALLDPAVLVFAALEAFASLGAFAVLGAFGAPLLSCEALEESVDKEEALELDVLELEESLPELLSRFLFGTLERDELELPDELDKTFKETSAVQESSLLGLS